ncbi:MAG TPA: hypothetical protein VFC10_07490 [Terriglobia bacterium]|nr:hypothetical protein [Terracidiphilus sp.]HZT69577.1 hypothetical protein [Terriglobia bacterium]
MSQLTFSSIPGFFDIQDSAIAAGQPLTDDSIQKISHNAKAGAVRNERIYMGFFKNGDVVPVPTSPVDGYQYSRSEVQYDFVRYSIRAPAAGFVSGQAARPPQANSQPAGVYWFVTDIDDSTGQVFMQTSYWDGSHETITNDGVVKVYAVCQRLSVNQAN